jgi:hypothetical protein
MFRPPFPFCRTLLLYEAYITSLHFARALNTLHNSKVVENDVMDFGGVRCDWSVVLGKGDFLRSKYGSS